MGTNGIPFYLEKLRYKPSLIEEIASLLREESENRLRRKKFRRWGAIEAFRILGERGEPAIPKLVHYASSTREPIAQECAFKCLACIGQPAMPALAALMTNSVPRVRLLALRQSISFGTNALIAVQLARLESDPDRDVRIKAVKREQSQAQARR
jgi:HEAT repeat protein